ncbi:MAG: FmdB family transcriptional regulator [Actinobacteria bacterium]|nr:FmdB family transcriptional regulator [Actinomycetota bacterium]
MPTYVYKFIETGETIEVQQSFSDASLTEAEHPETGEVMAVRKVFTPVGVTFKGGGFYKTDSRGGSSASKSAGSTSSSGSSGGSGSSDSGSSASSTPAPAAPAAAPAASSD